MRVFSLTSGTDTVTFNGLTPDADGVYWYCSDLDGWDGADVSQQLQNRLAPIPGVVTVAGQVLGKTMTTKGTIVYAPTENLRRRAKDRLNALLLAIADPDVPGTLVVQDPSADPLVPLRRQCLVVTNTRPVLAELEPGTGMATGLPMMVAWPFQVTATLLAPDPVRYQVTAASIIVPNATPTAVGPLASNPTAPMPPKCFLSPDTGTHHVNITDGVLQVVLDGDMTGVTTLVVDFGAQTVVDQAGVDRFDLVTSPPNQWWALDPAGSTVTLDGLTGDATLYYQPSWW